MSEKQRLHWLTYRWERWQRWSFHCNELGSSAGNDGPRVQSSRKPSDLLNKVDFDSVEMDMAVCDLRYELKAVVLAYYLYPEKASVSVLARKLGISRSTFYQRLYQADCAVAQWLEDHSMEKYLF